MPRRMSMASRMQINSCLKENPKAVGPRMGQVALKYNIPAQAFALLLHVSPQTVYRWFYGVTEPRPVYLRGIRKIMFVMKRAAVAGDLPLRGTHLERMDAVRDVIVRHKPQPIE